MTRGEELRAAIDAAYDVEGPVSEVLVDQIVATADELELLERAVAESGVLIDGARGQAVANPALAGIARHRALLTSLLKQAFPDVHESVSQRAARAARSRWKMEGVRRA